MVCRRHGLADSVAVDHGLGPRLCKNCSLRGPQKFGPTEGARIDDRHGGNGSFAGERRVRAFSRSLGPKQS